MYGKDYKHLRFKNYITQDIAARILGASRHTLAIYETEHSEIPVNDAPCQNSFFELCESETDKYMLK